MLVTTEEIFKRLQEEKKTGELLPLPGDFYKQAESNQNKTQNNDQDWTREVENTQRLIKNLKEKRTQKILIYLAYGKPLPSQVPTEEEALYRQIQQILNKSAPKEKIKQLKMLANLPEIITTKGNKIGPFKQNQIVEVSSTDDVEFIINNKLGEIISQ